MAKPMTPMAVSMTVQVFSVVFSSRPKNRLTSQKPESLTCERTVAPAAIANTSSDIARPEKNAPSNAFFGL